MVLTVSFALSLVTGLSCHHPRVMQSIVASLTPASGRQDHTISPSATRAFVWCAVASIASSVQRFVTIAKRPSCGQKTRGKMLVICPTLQAKGAATHWHDGQITLRRLSDCQLTKIARSASRHKADLGSELAYVCFGPRLCENPTDGMISVLNRGGTDEGFRSRGGSPAGDAVAGMP